MMLYKNDLKKMAENEKSTASKSKQTVQHLEKTKYRGILH